MAIVHVKSNAVADATGTITVWNGATTQSVAATDVVRPSDWNSNHNYGYTITGNTTNASTVSATDVQLSGGPGIAIGGSNSTLIFQAKHRSDWEPIKLGNNSSFSSYGHNTLYFQGLQAENNVTMTAVQMLMSLSSATSTANHSVGQTISYGLYSRGTGGSTSQYASMATSSFVMQVAFSSNTSGGATFGNANTSYTVASGGTAFGSAYSGQKILSLPFATSLDMSGDYLFAFANSTASVGATGALRASFIVLTNATNASFGVVANTSVLVSNASNTWQPQQVIYSATSGAWPATIGRSQLSQNSLNQAYVYFEG